MARVQLPDEYVEQILEEQRSLGRVWAKAKAKASAMVELRKTTKAFLMKTARLTGDARSREAAEVAAYTSAQYKEVSDGMVAAIEAEVVAQVEYDVAVREWESWRSLNANDRHIK